MAGVFRLGNVLPRGLLRGDECLLSSSSASQNSYRVDANQELLAIGEATAGASPPWTGLMVVRPVSAAIAWAPSTPASAWSPCRALPTR